MGEIMEVSEGSTNVTYKVDDRTGPWMEVKRWIDEQVRGEGGSMRGREKEWRESKWEGGRRLRELHEHGVQVLLPLNCHYHLVIPVSKTGSVGPTGASSLSGRNVRKGHRSPETIQQAAKYSGLQDSSD